MGALAKIKRKIGNIFTDIYCNRQADKLQGEIKRNPAARTLYLFCAPTHSNLGDQAQLFCWLRLFKEWYPNHRIICVPTRYRRLSTLFEIKKKIKKDDLVFVHSGYLLYDPHPELPFIQDVVNAFYDHPVTILPQTVNLLADWFQHVVAQCFNNHPSLTLICRDDVSYAKAQQLFPKVKLRLMPDVVTSLIGNKDFHYHLPRRGICFCTRNDGEKFYSDEQLRALKERFGKIRTSQCDTTIEAPISAWETQREKLIRKMLRRLAQYQVVVTDRYHGTIFSQIVNTPVVVISSGDHKLSSGVKWFPREEFGKNIYFEETLDGVYSRVMEILARNWQEIVNPSWFKENYYSSPL